MEKEEHMLEQTELEEQEEKNQTTLVVRKSRNGNHNKTTEIAATGFEVSHGVSESNGRAVHTKSVENGTENEEKTPAQGPNKEKLNGVLENVSEAINGEHKSENLVFYDNVEDVESEHTNFGEKQILKDPKPQKLDISSLDFVVQNNSTFAINNRNEGEIESNSISSSNSKPSQTTFKEGFTSYDSSKEIGSEEFDPINEDDLEVVAEVVERVIKKQTTHDLYCPNCNSCITKRVILRKRKRIIRVSDEEVKRNKTETTHDPKLGSGLLQSLCDQVDDNDAQISAANEDERERRPDIFRCLSCFSFFIPTGDGFKLFHMFGDESGKQTVQDEQEPSVKKNWFKSMFTSNKMETSLVEQGSQDAAIPSSNLSGQSGQPSSSQNARTPTQEGGYKILTHPNQEPSINRKVAVGVGDKLDTKATKTVDKLRESRSSQVLNGNHERDPSVTTLPMRTQVTNGKPSEDAISYSQEGGLKLLISENHGSLTLGNSVQLSKQTVQPGAAEQDLCVTTLPMRTQFTNGKPSEDVISYSQEGGPKLLISENNGSSTLGNSVQLSKQTVQPGAADKEVTQLTPTSVPVLKASDVDGKLNISVSIPHAEQDVRATIQTESVLENKNANFSSSDGAQVHHTEVSQHITTKTEIEVHPSEPLKVSNISTPNNAAILQGKDTVIVIDQQPAESAQTMQGVTHPKVTASVSQSATHSSVADSGRTEARKEYEIEVVKSIVYGGLAESITSLSVVSSAVGSGAATSNVLALGAANLIGGLVIIFHNLWNLKCDRVEQVSNQIVEQRGCYNELLGRRHNFILHAIVAITSYIIFGLVPPIVYGFSFLKSDDKQLKLVVVEAASLACILVLATAKAYTQRHPKPYLKTVTTYVILGFMFSGFSYAAGELIERLLDELGLFQTASGPNLVVPEIRPTGLGWASY